MTTCSVVLLFLQGEEGRTIYSCMHLSKITISFLFHFLINLTTRFTFALWQLTYGTTCKKVSSEGAPSSTEFPQHISRPHNKSCKFLYLHSRRELPVGKNGDESCRYCSSVNRHSYIQGFLNLKIIFWNRIQYPDLRISTIMSVSETFTVQPCKYKYSRLKYVFKSSNE